MGDVLCQYGLEHRVEPLNRRLVHVPPPAARLEQHEGLTGEKSDVEIGRIRLIQIVDEIGPLLVELAALILVVLGCIPLGHCLNQGSLDLGGMAVHDLQRFLDRGVGSWCVGGHHWAVQVRAPRPGLAEVAHRAVRIAFPALAKRTCAEVRVEGVDELHPLIEIKLRLVGGRGDRTRKGPESLAVVVDRHRLVETGRELGPIVLCNRGSGNEQADCTGQQ